MHTCPLQCNTAVFFVSDEQTAFLSNTAIRETVLNSLNFSDVAEIQPNIVKIKCGESTWKFLYKRVTGTRVKSDVETFSAPMGPYLVCPHPTPSATFSFRPLTPWDSASVPSSLQPPSIRSTSLYRDANSIVPLLNRQPVQEIEHLQKYLLHLSLE